MRDKSSYKSAGVDIELGNEFIKRIKPLVKATFRSEVLAGIGGFGGLFSINSAKYSSPVLVSSTDGVGTKLKLAFMMDKHDTVGIDLVAMSVNDVVVQGAEPLFFLDYFATGKLDIEKSTKVIEGIVKGCKEAGCALIGGETAEMPGFYKGGEYDLAGFAVGIADKDKIIDGSIINIGEKIVGLASSGLHSNGYSLARKVVFELLKHDISDIPSGFASPIGETLLTPTRIYVKPVLNLLKDFTISGIAHITGGGLIDNISRILPEGCKAVISKRGWEVPHLFTFLKEAGKIGEKEMLRTFNNGIGMILIVKEENVEDILNRLKGLNETAYMIGEICRHTEGEKVEII